MTKAESCRSAEGNWGGTYPSPPGQASLCAAVGAAQTVRPVLGGLPRSFQSTFPASPSRWWRPTIQVALEKVQPRTRRFPCSLPPRGLASVVLHPVALTTLEAEAKLTDTGPRTLRSGVRRSRWPAGEKVGDGGWWMWGGGSEAWHCLALFQTSLFYSLLSRVIYLFKIG